MDFYKDFPERSDSGTATTPDGSVVAGSDKLNDNDYTMVGANGTGSNSQGKGYKVKFSSIYNYLKSKFLGDSGMEATSETRGLISADSQKVINSSGIPRNIITGGCLTNNKLFQALSGGFEVSDNAFEITSDKILFGGKILKRFFNPSDSGEHLCFSNEIAVKHSTDYTLSLYAWSGGDYGRFASASYVYIDDQPVHYFNIGFAYGWTKTVFRFKTAPKSGEIGGLLTRLKIRVGVGLNNGGSAWIAFTGFSLSEGFVSDWMPTAADLMQPTTTLAASYIAERYSIDEEQALTRRMIANDPTVVEQFEAYSAYCEECKVKAKEELSNKPQVLPADELNNQTI